jgi:putative ABC transport system ATP-binding protein
MLHTWAELMSTSSSKPRAEPARVEVLGLGKDHGPRGRSLTVLDSVNLVIEPGQFVAITGPSGSGKSTLLGLLAGLDRPSRGHVRVDGTTLSELSEEGRTLFRGRHIGFVFQSFQLIPTLTALENVRLVAELLGDAELARSAPARLAEVGLSERSGHYPSQLSGGEMQRVAIARALITRPSLLLADEPTGNLDSVTGELVLKLLLEVGRSTTLVLVTHNPEIAERAEREVRMRDGRVVQDLLRAAPCA